MGEVTGTSAVNAKGEVFIFVDRELSDFVDFIIEDNRIILCGIIDPDYNKVYGALALATVRRRGVLTAIYVDEYGNPSDAVILEARHGC